MVIRTISQQGSSSEDMRIAKSEYLEVIYRILCIHLGTPPKEFMWQWEDKDKEFHRDGILTPVQFAEKYISIPYKDYVCIVNDARTSSPFERTYTVKFLGNIISIAQLLNNLLDNILFDSHTNPSDYDSLPTV